MPEQRETDASGAERLLDLEIWRVRVLQFVLWLTVGFGFPPLAAWTLSKLDQGRGVVTLPMWAFYAALIALARARRASFRARASTFLLCMFSSGTVAIVEYGFRGQGPFLYLAVATMAVVFLGLREGVIVFALGLLVIAITGVLFVQGRLHDTGGHPLTAVSPWITLGATFCMVGVSLLAAVGVLMRRLESSLASERALVQDLRREVDTAEVARAEALRELTERKRAEERLEQRDRVLHAVGFAAQKLLVSRRWEDCADEVLRVIGEAAGVERVTMAEFTKDAKGGDVMTQRFYWIIDGKEHWAARKDMGEVPVSPVPMAPFMAELRAGKAIRMLAADLPETSRPTADALAFAVGAMLPISLDGTLWGFLALSSADPKFELPEHLMDALQAAAGSLSAAIGRDRLNAELEARVAERTERLALANEELEAFSYTVSHDLRAPLRHVGAYLGMLRDENGAVLNDKAIERMNVIAGAAERMTKMIDDLLQFYRLGRASFASQKLDLDGLVAEVIAEHEHETRARDVAWNVGRLPELRADRALMKHVFSNLIGNALKYTSSRDHAEIAVGTEANDGEVVLFVRDNGVGFDPSQGHRLFHVFQRLHPLHDFEGSGVGLAHVKRIVERHGGRVWAKGVVDRGATFYLAFPVSAQPA